MAKAAGNQKGESQRDKVCFESAQTMFWQSKGIVMSAEPSREELVELRLRYQAVKLQAKWLIDRSVAYHLSAAKAEVLAIVWHDQPVTRKRVADVRGVGSDRLIKALEEMGLIELIGFHSESRSALYATSMKFYSGFEMQSVPVIPTGEQIATAGTPSVLINPILPLEHSFFHVYIDLHIVDRRRVVALLDALNRLYSLMGGGELIIADDEAGLFLSEAVAA